MLILSIFESISYTLNKQHVIFYEKQKNEKANSFVVGWCMPILHNNTAQYGKD